MPISDVQHQERACRIVRLALASRRVPHAYIFHGPDGVGKEMLAGRVAAALLCNEPVTEDGGIDACGTCRSCTLCAAGTHPDYAVIHRRLNRYHPKPEVRDRKAMEMSIDVVRHFLIDKVANKPSMGRARVFVIRQADRITTAAQNALLKTLEEPPPTTFLILLVESLDRMLATTLSRCQLVGFGPLPADFVLTKLRELRPDVTDDVARFFACFTGGQLGVALQRIDNGLYEYNVRLRQSLGRLTKRDVPGWVKQIEGDAKTLGEGFNEREPDASATESLRWGVRSMLALISGWYRDAVYLANGLDDQVSNTDDLAGLREWSKRHDVTRAVDAIELLNLVEYNLGRNANVQLCLERVGYGLAE